MISKSLDFGKYYSGVLLSILSGETNNDKLSPFLTLSKYHFTVWETAVVSSQNIFYGSVMSIVTIKYFSPRGAIFSYGNMEV